MSHFYKEDYNIVAPAEVNWIIDLGANIGDETVKFALRHTKASILAVEPEVGNFSLLVANSKVFSSRIHPLNCGVWWKDARLNICRGMSDRQSNESFSVLEDLQGPIEGRCIRSLMQQFKIEQIDILKIDIEGSELDLFKNGVEDWLPCVRSIIVEIHDRPGNMQTLFRAFDKLGLDFEFMICGESIVGLTSNSGFRLCKQIGI